MDEQTTRLEVAKERFEVALKHLQFVKTWVNEVEPELKQHIQRIESRTGEYGYAFDFGWAGELIKRADLFGHEVSRGNGAVLVRSKSGE